LWLKKEDEINQKVGFVFNKKVGDTVSQGEILGYIHLDDQGKLNYVMAQEIFLIE
jgi:thymidine phosphorylase